MESPDTFRVLTVRHGLVVDESVPVGDRDQLCGPEEAALLREFRSDDRHGFVARVPDADDAKRFWP